MFERAEAATATIRALLIEGRPLSVSWSAGKDSSAALNLVLAAAATLRAEGHTLPPIVVSHGDTLIENPEIATHARSELEKVRAFATRHALDVRVHIVSPALNQSWAFRTIGQGKLPTFPGDKRECSTEFKVLPQARALKNVVGSLRAESAGHEPVVVIGTRFSESPERLARMKERGESPDRPWSGTHGFDYLSPIAEWSINDVWAYLGLAADMALLGDGVGGLLYYSDFQDTLRIYAAATGQACGIGGDLTVASSRRAEACGARFGCYLCTAVGRDKSLETMIESDERYGYMEGLNRLQRWLLATRFAWSGRSWLGRSINEAGYQRIQPDTYSPAFVEDLLRYCLTLDAIEAERSQALGIEPRYQILGPEMVVAIDAEWSRYGTHRPFHALKIFLDVVGGARYPVPEINEVPRTDRPEARYAFVGRDWDGGHDWTFTGLRSIHEMHEGCPAFRTTTLANGLEILDVNTESEFAVDPEGAWLILSLEAERLVRTYHDDPQVGITHAFEIYMALGTIALSPRQRSATDMILRRTAFRERNGLAGPDPDIQTLLDASISKTEMQATLETMKTIRDRLTPEPAAADTEEVDGPEPTPASEQLDLLAVLDPAA